MQSQIVNISLPTKLLKLADKVAKKEARSRSELFREAIRSYLLRKDDWNKLFTYAELKAKKLKIAEKDVENLVSEYRKGKN